MASEKEAHLAREKHSDLLRDLGAHAIAVDEVRRKGEKTYAVIAFFDKKPGDIPDTLEIQSHNRTSQVPLVARVAEKFRPE